MSRSLISTLGLLFVVGLAFEAFAQGPNSQLLCFKLLPASNPGMSPGLNRGTAEGQWILCQAVIDGASLTVADEAEGIAGDGDYQAEIVFPTFTTRNDANGISDLAVAGIFGGEFTDIAGMAFDSSDPAVVPAGHPALTTPQDLGAFGTGGTCTQAVSVDSPIPPIKGGSGVGETTLFNQAVWGVDVAIDMTCDPTVTRIDLFFAARLAPDGLKKIAGTNGQTQDFPGKESANGNGGPDGAAQYFSGPGPLFTGFFVGDPTGVATVPIRVEDADGEEPSAVLSSIHGSKFCDADVSGGCSGEKLVNGTVVTVMFCDLLGGSECDAAETVTLETGATGVEGDPSQPFSMATVEIRKTHGGPNGTLAVTLLIDTVSAGPGEYWLAFDRICEGNKSDGGQPLILTISETLDTSVFDDQTAPLDDADNSDGKTAAGGVYTVELGCEADQEDLDFGNVAFVPAEGDPHTIGFWGASLIKSAINSFGPTSTCGDAEAPGQNVLPVNDGQTEYTSPAQVALLIDTSVPDDCAAFPEITGIDPSDPITAAQIDALVCAGAFQLPPKQFDNSEGQLLGFLLNVGSGLIPEGTLIDPICALDPEHLQQGGIDDLFSAEFLAALACANPAMFQPLLDAINNLDESGGVVPCLVVPTCPDDPKVTGAVCSE
ncbi:MAG: hypothetical protein V3T08_02780 [Gemmatimonadota bacterium]